MFLENPRRRKFTEFMTHHILGHEDRDEGFAIVDVEGVSDEIRGDRRAARPSFDRLLRITFIEAVNLVEQLPLNKRAFF